MVVTRRADEEERDGPDSEKRYLGQTLAFVRDSADPEQRGRVRVHCPEVMGEVDSPNTWLDWAEAKHFMSGFDQGLMAVPPDPTWKRRDAGGESSPYNQTRVWVSFRNGDPTRPVYEPAGSWYGENHLPSHTPKLITADNGGDETTAAPNFITSTTKYNVLRQTEAADLKAQDPDSEAKAGDLATGGDVREPGPASAAQYPFNHIYKSPAGHVVEFDNTKGSERFRLYHPAGTSIEVNQAGSMATKVQGQETRFITNDSTRVVKGGDTSIVEGAAHRQIGRTSTELFLDSRMEVVEKTYDCFYKGGWAREVGGRVSTICADFQLESVGTVMMTGGAAMTLSADEMNLGSNLMELSSTDTVVKSETGVKLSLAKKADAVHPIYASLDIDSDLQSLLPKLEALSNEEAVTILLAPVMPGTGANIPGVVFLASTLATAARTIILALQKNKSDHLVDPGSNVPDIEFPDFPKVPEPE